MLVWKISEVIKTIEYVRDWINKSERNTTNYETTNKPKSSNKK
jgi:hypothetical protein